MNSNNKKVLRYLTVGGSSVIVEYGIFLILYCGASWLIIANIVSFFCGLLYSFYLHRRWSFKGEHIHGVKKQFITYGSLAVTNMIVTSGIIFALVNWIMWKAWIAKIACMGLVACWNYLILNRHIFQHINIDTSQNIH